MSLYVGDRLVGRYGWNWFGWVGVFSMPDVELIKLLLLMMST